MPSIDPKILEVTEGIVSRLVAQQYVELEKETRSQRLTADEMRAAILEYGAALAMPPQEASLDLSVVQVSASSRPEWSVSCPLWDVDGNRTDLTLELTLYDDGGPRLSTEIDGIHVL